MAIDIELAIPANAIKNGTLITTCSFTGNFNTISTHSRNEPVITDIESKYDEKFDDITYYVLGY